MANKIVDILSSIFVVAMITTLVLPGRQTPQVISASGSALSSVTYAALGIR